MADVIELPVDRDGRTIHVGDRLALAHNGRQITVNSLEFMGTCWHVWPEEDGGGFQLPDAAFNVTVID